MPVEGLRCRALELAVQVDAPSDGALRFEGFALDSDGAGIRDARFERVEITSGPLAGLEASGDLGTTRHGHPILGATSPADRVAACESGPRWVRLSGEDLQLTVSGHSGTEPFTEECTLAPRDVLVTCHSGPSRIGVGRVEVVDFGGTVTTETTATVYVRDEPSGEEEVQLEGAALHTETMTVLEMAAGDSRSAMVRSFSDEPSLTLFWQGEPLDDAACPSGPVEPPPLILTYEGTLAGTPFTGAAPAGRCAR